MQNYYKTIGALVVASAFAAGNASAEVESEIHVGYTSEYIFRGINYGDDLVEAGVDVATEYNGFGLSAGAWYASFESGGFNATELDLYAEVSRDLGFATAAIGYIYYINDPGSNAEELYFSLARTFYGIDYSLTYFWDIEGENDGYTELAASKGFPINECLTLSTSAALGYLVEQSEFSHVSAKVALDYAFTETATLSPFVAHSWSLTDEGTHVNTENEFVAGTMLSVSF